jgi:predicted PurR-regulated permease PerM
LAYIYLLHTLLNKGEFFDINNIETMEITSFILGVLAVIVIMMVVIASVNFMTIRVLTKKIDSLEQNVGDSEREFHQRLSTEIQNLSQRANNDDNEIIRYIDSRVDKLESKVYKDFDTYGQQGKPY